MKRLTFKKEHVGPVSDGTKTATSRWRDQRIYVGDVVAAVAGKDKKPAFLTPASEAFCHLRIKEAQSILFSAYTEDHARKCGFESLEQALDWYRKERPTAGDFDRINFYEFERVEK